MNDQFKLILETAYNLSEANKKLKSDIEKVKKEVKLQFNVDIDDKTAKQSINQVKNEQIKAQKEYNAIRSKVATDESKMWAQRRKESVESITATNTELRKMAQYYKDLEKSTQSDINLSFGKKTLDNQITTYLKENTKLSSELQSKFAQIQGSINSLDATGLRNARTEFSSLKSEVTALGLSGKTTFQNFQSDLGNFTTFLTAGTTIMGTINAVRSMVKNVIELDSSLVELQKVSDLSGKSLTDFTNRAFEMGAQVARTGKDVIDATSVFKRAGYTLEQSFDLAKVSLIMTNVGDGIDNVEEASSALIATLKGFKLSDTDAMSVIDMINSTSNQAAIDFDNITEGLRRVSGTLSQTGSSIQQTIGLLTGGFGSLRDIEMVSSGLIMISQRLRGIDEDGKAIDGLAPKLKAEFKEIANIDIENSNGELRSTYDILSDMARVFPTLTSKQRQYLGELASGNRQIKVLNAIVDGWGDVEQAVNSATNSQGSALAENEKVLNSISGKINAFQSEFQKMSVNFVDSNFVKGIVDLGTGVLNLINSMGGLLPVVVTLGTAFTLMKTGILPSLIGQIGMLVMAQTGYTASTVSAALAQVGLTGAIKATTIAMKSFLLTNPVGWAILAGTAIFGAVKAFDHFNVSLEENQAALSNLKGEYDSITTEVKSLEDQISSIQKRMEELQQLKPLEFATDDEYKKLSDSNDQLNRRLTIQKELQRIAGKEAENKAIETIDSKSEKSITKTVSTMSNSGSERAVEITREEAIKERINAYNNLSVKIDEIEKKQLKLAQSGDTETKEYKKLSKEISSLTNKRDEHYSYVVQTMDALDKESDSIIGATRSGSKYKNTIDALGETVNSFISSTKGQIDALSEVSNATQTASDAVADSFDISKYSDNFKALSSSISTAESALEKLRTGKLTDSDVFQLMQDLPGIIPYVDMTADSFGNLESGLKSVANSNFDNLIYTLEQVKTTSNETDAKNIDNVIASIKSMKQSFGDSAKVTLSLSDALTKLNSGSKLIDDLNKEVEKYKTISIESLNDIIAKYPTLEKAVSDYLAGKTDEITLIGKIQEAYNADFENYKSLMIVKNGYNEDFYTNVLNNLEPWVNTQAEAYGVDLKNYKTLVEAKLALEKEFLTKLGNAYSETEGLVQTVDGRKETDSNLARIRSALSEFNSITTGINATFDKSFDIKKYQIPKTKGDEKKFENQYDWTKASIENLEKAVSDFSSTMNSSDPYSKQLDDVKKLISLQTNLKDGYKKQADEYEEQFKKASKSLPQEYIDRIKKGDTFKIEEFSGLSDGEQEKLFNQITKTAGLYKQFQDSLDSANETTIKIADNTQKIADIELKANFEEFDKSLAKINKTLKETDTLSKFFDDGSIEQLVLLQTGYEQASEKTKQLNDEISDLNKKYAKGKIEQKDYTDRLEDLTNQLYDSASAMKSYQDSIISAMKKRYDDQADLIKDNLKTELDAIEKARKATIDSLNSQIKKRKEAVDSAKNALRKNQETDNFNEKVAEYNSSISSSESRLAELNRAIISGDRSAIKEKTELENKLAEDKKALAKLQKDREIDLAEDALDESYDAYEEMMNKQISDMESYYETEKTKAQQVHDDKMAKITTLYETEKAFIIEAANLTSTEFAKAFDSINSTLSKYGISMSGDLKSVYNDTGSKVSGVSKVSSILGEANSNKPVNATGLSQLNQYLGSKGYNTINKDQMVDIAQALGLSDIKKIGDVEDTPEGRINKNRIMEALKKAGFKTGGIILDNDMIRQAGENRLVLGRNGEALISTGDKTIIKDLLNNLKPLNNLVKLSTPNSIDYSQIASGSRVFKIDTLLRIDNVTDSTLVPKIQSATDNAIDKLNTWLRQT